MDRPSVAAPKPPPSVPQLLSSSSQLSRSMELLTQYLNTFSLWCRGEYADRIPSHQALPFILLEANDAPSGTTPKVFSLSVNSAGALVTTVVPLGKGLP